MIVNERAPRAAERIGKAIRLLQRENWERPENATTALPRLGRAVVDRAWSRSRESLEEEELLEDVTQTPHGGLCCNDNTKTSQQLPRRLTPAQEGTQTQYAA